MRHGVHWYPGAGANADRCATHRHSDAHTHTAADGYADPGSAHGHEHAIADGNLYSRAAHSYAGATDCHTFSQA